MRDKALLDSVLYMNRSFKYKGFHMRNILALGLIVFFCSFASGQMVITEWMYSGTDGEFIEFTNVGTDPVDMTGWSYDDKSQVPGTVDLSAFGVVEAGESVILTEAVATDFATAWGLTDVTIIGEAATSLGRNDQINLYDSVYNLVDELTFGDEDNPGTPRTQNASCNIPEADYSETLAQMSWILATVADAYGSRMSTGGDIASPGRIVGYALSDYDMDGDVGLSDLVTFVTCFTGEGISYDPLPTGSGLTLDEYGLIPVDADQDYDVDLLDFGVFASCYSGEGNAADVYCGRSIEEAGTTQIILNGDSITVEGTGVTVDGTTATITTDGSYNVSGTLTNGQLVVNSPTNGLVEIILDGVNISNSTSAPIYVVDASFTSIVLADQTQNYLFDASEYVYDDPTVNEPSGCLFSDDSMAISGSGTLNVQGNYNDAIVCKDKLVVYSGTLNITSVDDGIRGKDNLLIKDGNFTLVTEGDGLVSDNEDPNWGYITIQSGTLDITSGGDGIAAESEVTVEGGDITIVSGGGHNATISYDLSAKGIKGLVSVEIEGGTINLNCADDGLHSDNAVTISGGTTVVASGGDGIHADLTIEIEGGAVNITDSYEGIESADITISDGDITVVSDEDAITADNTVAISGGVFDITSGGGYNANISDDLSAKGIKAAVGVTIDGGTFAMSCADDAIHTNEGITINGGTFEIASGDDGIHADSTIDINGGTITVTNSYEGIEAAIVTINDGNIHVTASDDGLNVAGGNDSSGGDDPWHRPGGGIPPGGDTGNYFLYINGGNIVVNAAGDGLDANGSIVITGGTTLVNGPTADNNNAVDFDGSCNISGGILVGVGSSQMAQSLSTTSTQRSIKITYNSWKSAGSLIHIETSAGTEVLTFTPAKAYKSCVFSSPDLVSGTTYKLYNGGSSTGTNTDGLYTGGTYSPGTLTTSFTTTSIATNVSAP